MKYTVAINWAGLLIFAVSGVVLNMSAVAAAGGNKGDDDGDELKGFLGMRPDLADDLNPMDSADSNPDVNEPGAVAGAMPGAIPAAAADVTGAKAQKEGMDCVSECLLTDQSCRARCLGVPGVASRKTPRKQDIEGNLPLNWKKNSKDDVVKPKSAEDVSGAGGTHVASVLEIVGVTLALGLL
ncbi:hypothetical protein IWW45_008066 [Coemansia sp. RSA 485]|nr:hypothetical protein IWW45_008066 [Coemansia sp. RSA 485]